MILLNLFYIALGTILLVFGANCLVGGASGLAKKLGISTLVIGLTVIAFGTSSPELFINVSDALKGESQIGYGMIMGSNIINVLLVLGLTSVIYPIVAKPSTLNREIPFFIIASISLFALTYDTLRGGNINILTRLDGIILLILFGLYLYYIVTIVREQKKLFSGKRAEVKEMESSVEDEILDDKSIEIFGFKRDLPKEFRVLKFPVFIIFGLLLLVFGSDFIVDGASGIAEKAGWSPAFIGLTIVAIGTGLPEIATNITAAFKKNTDLAIGNIVGTNIFNSLAILGITSTIIPISVEKGFIINSLVEIAASILLLGIMFVGTKGQLTRTKGFIFLAIYAIYLSYTIWVNVA